MKDGIEGEPFGQGSASSFDCRSSEASSSDAAFRERVVAAAARLRKQIRDSSMVATSSLDEEWPKTPQLTPRSEVSSTEDGGTGAGHHNNMEVLAQDARATIATVGQAAMATMTPAGIRMTEAAARIEAAVARFEEVVARAEATEAGCLSPTSCQTSSQRGTPSNGVTPSPAAFGGGVGDGRGGAGGLREWMQEVYAKYNPEKVAQIDSLLHTFRTNEHVLIGSTLKMYGHLEIGFPIRWSPAQMGVEKPPRRKTPVLSFSSTQLTGLDPTRAVSTAASMAEIEREAQALCRAQVGLGAGATAASPPAQTVAGEFSWTSKG
ncbi:unnamed protein product [Ectocarpus fasciculatus]